MGNFQRTKNFSILNFDLWKNFVEHPLTLLLNFSYYGKNKKPSRWIKSTSIIQVFVVQWKYYVINDAINCRKLFIYTSSQVKKTLICFNSLNLLVTFTIEIYVFWDHLVRHDSRIWAGKAAIKRISTKCFSLLVLKILEKYSWKSLLLPRLQAFRLQL